MTGWSKQNLENYVDKFFWSKQKIAWENIRLSYSQTPLCGHLLNTDTSLLRTVWFVPGERKPLCHTDELMVSEQKNT